MSKQSERKEKTHGRLIESASKGYRSYGYMGIGVDAIAKNANATSGAFYAHLGSKQKAFIAVLEEGLQEVVEAVPQFQQTAGDKWLNAFVDYYLGEAHRLDVECGCAMTALTPDVVRANDEIKQVYERYMKIIVDEIAKGLPGVNSKQRAWAILHSLIGALNVTRALSSNEAIAAAVTATKRNVVQLGSKPTS